MEGAEEASTRKAHDRGGRVMVGGLGLISQMGLFAVETRVCRVSLSGCFAVLLKNQAAIPASPFDGLGGRLHASPFQLTKVFPKPII